MFDLIKTLTVQCSFFHVTYMYVVVNLYLIHVNIQTGEYYFYEFDLVVVNKFKYYS